MHPFAAGDIVECVDDTPLPGRVPRPGEAWIKLGRWYRVSAATTNIQGEHGVCLVGIPTMPPSGGWHAWRFRRIDPADDAFVQLLKTLAAADQERIYLPA